MASSSQVVLKIEPDLETLKKWGEQVQKALDGLRVLIPKVPLNDDRHGWAAYLTGSGEIHWLEKDDTPPDAYRRLYVDGPA